MSISEPAGIPETAPLEATGVVRDGKIVLSSSVELPEGAEVRVVVVRRGGEQEPTPLERRRGRRARIWGSRCLGRSA